MKASKLKRVNDQIQLVFGSIYSFTQDSLKVESESVSCSVMSYSLHPHGLQPTRFLCPWFFPGKNTAVSCHFTLQGIFLTQGLNPGLLHCRQILYQLRY